MQHPTSIPKFMRERIDRELDPGENIRWIERPARNLLELVIAVVAVWIFAVPWTGFAIFWIWGAWGFRWPDWRQGIPMQFIFGLFGVPFVLIGVAMLVGPFWAWYERGNAVYLITNKRAIAFEGMGKTQIRSFFPHEIQNLHRREYRSGMGDVMLGVRSWKDSEGDERKEDIGFKGVRNAKEVERMLRSLMEESR
ncbi:MAG: hypothetical protein MUF49_17925 [Oculatellaceae cyanobacterium Prado106]|jgi:hypothetical protein|nr:hypothetical protein [Oculatellaceae cyanobacterium Prado106]